MPPKDIDAYLAGLDDTKRKTLQRLRETILSVVPDATETISYGMPAFKVEGKTIAGFAAFKNHLSYMPHSGTVVAALGEDVAGYTTTKGSLQFPIDKPLPKALVKKLIGARLDELRKR